jgi:hypothetical protein
MLMGDQQSSYHDQKKFLAPCSGDSAALRLPKTLKKSSIFPEGWKRKNILPVSVNCANACGILRGKNMLSPALRDKP